MTIPELKSRTNPLPCDYCGESADSEVTNIRLVKWTDGHVEREVSVRCARCSNLKYGVSTSVENGLIPRQ